MLQYWGYSTLTKIFGFFHCLWSGMLKIQVRNFLLQPYLIVSARRRAPSTTWSSEKKSIHRCQHHSSMASCQKVTAENPCKTQFFHFLSLWTHTLWHWMVFSYLLLLLDPLYKDGPVTYLSWMKQSEIIVFVLILSFEVRTSMLLIP